MQSPRASASATPPMSGGGDKRTPASSTSSSRWRKPPSRYGPGCERSSDCQKEGPCSSSPSVSSKKSPLQMATPVQALKSVDSPQHKVASDQLSKSVDSPPQMVTPVQTPESVNSLSQLVASVQITKSLDSRSTSCASGSVVSDPGAAPFDICRVVSKCSVEVKPSLLDIKREKRRAKELAKSANALQHLGPGMVLLKNFIKPDDQAEEEKAESNVFSIPKCISALQNMKDLTREERVKASKLFKTVENRETFLTWAAQDEESAVMWLRGELQELP